MSLENLFGKRKGISFFSLSLPHFWPVGPFPSPPARWPFFLCASPPVQPRAAQQRVGPASASNRCRAGLAPQQAAAAAPPSLFSG